MAILPSSSVVREEEVQEASSPESMAGDFTSLSKAMHFNLQVKLDNDNYIYWKAQVLRVIRAFELEDFISGLKSAPSKYVEVQSAGEKQSVLNKSYVNWNKSDQLLLSWLFSSINQNLIGQVIDCKNSQEVWSTLENLFSQQSMAKILQLKHQLQNVKKGASSINDFVLKVKTIGDNLKAAGQVVSENDLILSILHGVGSEYDTVVSMITSQRSSMTLQEAQYLLLNLEQRIAEQNSVAQVDVSSASALYASGNQSDRRHQRGGYNGSGNFNNGGRFGGNRSRGRGRHGGRWNNNGRP
ncbi:hypothetical protein Q3G72_020893 [Acer saccharum]|nr:hypothetical protein Q3G72_020893 [Acer saccharum]